jgi:predicted metal-binding protein
MAEQMGDVVKKELSGEAAALCTQWIAEALEMGAVDAVPFVISDIVFDPRTLLKCMYGCSDWGKLHTCPSRPGSPSMVEYRDMFSRYRWGIIVHTHEKRPAQKISYELERRAYLAGYPLAFSLSDCGLCARCAGYDGEPCRCPKQARPAFHSVGVDVFATAHRLGLPLYPLHAPEQEQNWYAAVFVE